MLNLASSQMPAFGHDLAVFLASSRALRPLWRFSRDESEPRDARYGWTDAGCLILADALTTWLPCAEVHTVVSDTRGWRPTAAPPAPGDEHEKHTVVVVPDLGGRPWILDAFGASDYGTGYVNDHFPLQPTWIREGRPSAEAMIPEDAATSRIVAGLLAARFPGVRCCPGTGRCRAGSVGGRR